MAAANEENLLAGYDGEGAPKTSTTIAFNGCGKDAHESFILPQLAGNFKEFDFCKTAQKPYDVVVVACLTRLAEVPGIKVSSDGNASDWHNGAALASKILGRRLDNPLEKTANTLANLKIGQSLIVSEKHEAKYTVKVKLEIELEGKKPLEIIADEKPLDTLKNSLTLKDMQMVAVRHKDEILRAAAEQALKGEFSLK
jgi:hypothetical protein